jgi:hypothetical protein
MSEQKALNENGQTGASYDTPQLVTHGTVAELTQGTAGQQPDTNLASQPIP